MDRLALEKHESLFLSPYGLTNERSKGRTEPEPKDDFRLDFARDRDRILHTKAFRRLKGKTQVFVSGFGDHYRSRLTHSLEVAQIARTLARIFRANEDLVEAVALAHDLGHTPFGHAGQELLAKKLLPFGRSFEHNAQSRRILEVLEPQNLCIETLQCLCKHPTKQEAKEYHLAPQNYLEGQIVDIADAIAYSAADMQDGIASGLLSKEVVAFFPANPIDAMVHDLASHVLPLLLACQSPEDIRKKEFPIVQFSKDFAPLFLRLKKTLMSELYRHPKVLSQTQEGVETLDFLFHHYVQKVSDFSEGIVGVTDFLAGMTDDFAKEQRMRIEKGCE